MSLSRLVFLLSTLFLATATPTEYAAYHRFLPSPRSGQRTPDFVLYGYVSLDPEVDPTGSFMTADDRDPMMDDGRGMYQIGLKVGEEMLLTSTKAVSGVFEARF